MTKLRNSLCKSTEALRSLGCVGNWRWGSGHKALMCRGLDSRLKPVGDGRHQRVVIRVLQVIQITRVSFLRGALREWVSSQRRRIS